MTAFSRGRLDGMSCFPLRIVNQSSSPSATSNLAKANDYLKSKQLRPEAAGADSVVLGKDQAFGMVVGFTQRALPNDPR